MLGLDVMQLYKGGFLSFFLTFNFMLEYSGSNGKESACNSRDPDSIPGSERCPGGGHGNPLQYSCLENSMDTGPVGLQSMGLQSWTRLSD